MCLCTRPSRNSCRHGRNRRPFAKETDFLFPSLKAEGRVPVSPAVFVADHLRPAAKAAGLRDTGRLPFRPAQSPALAFKLAGE